MLTMDQIHAAQRHDFAGISAVLEALEDRRMSIARAAANRLKITGSHFADHLEDAAQEASLALWEALPRFTGETVDSFYAFMYSSMDSALKDKVRADVNQGADKDAVKVFAAMLERADGDLTLAERLSQSVPPKGVRLGADRARAARLAWQGTVSLDKPARQMSRSVVGPLGLSARGTDPVTIHDQLCATVADDLVTPEDLNSEDRAAKCATVNAVLDAMGQAQRVVLRHSFGIGGVTCYGHGDDGDDVGLSAEIGSTVVKVRDARTKGMKAFASRYIKAVANTEDEARVMAEAAAARLSRGGRK